MSYDLRREAWIPWRRRTGAVEWGPPAALVSRMAGEGADPIVAIAAPRPDFDGALQEFLIGLLSVSVQPKDETAWKAAWHRPPSVEELQAALDALPDAFDLESDGPRFFQDIRGAEFLEIDPKPIDQLLIDSPGDQGVSLNKDLFIKRARADTLGRHAAAMALITMQTYAPAGGQGYRTSMRGGGPLTTLVDPRLDEDGKSRAHEQPLWEKLWANVETQVQQADRSPPGPGAHVGSIFPWLEPTRTSNLKKGGTSTTPAQGHALQAYFGLPRRIRLEFGDEGACGLTGQVDRRSVIGFRAMNYGVQYDGWKHPLSPHYRTKLTEPWLPVHGQPGGIAWRDWLPLTLQDPTGGLREPARAVAHFGQWRARAVGRREFRVQALGYDMDNMKARGWTEAVVPAFAIIDEEHRQLLYSAARALVEATSMAGTALLVAVKTALFQSADDATGDLSQVKFDLWAATETQFYGAIRSIADDSLDGDTAITRLDEVRRAFAPGIEKAATAVFDRWCPVGGLDVDAIRRRVTARYQLTSALRGYSKLGESIFTALGIAPPAGGRAARAAKKSKTVKEKRG